MKILNIGSLNIDRVYTVDHFVQPGETLSSSQVTEFAGGKGLNQSIALARAGADVSHAGRIGKDGLFLKKLLADNGVDTTHIGLSAGPSGHAVIQVNPAGENSIILFGGANREISLSEMKSTLERFSPGDCLLLQNEINGTADLIRLAKDTGLRVAFNPAPMNEDVLELSLEHVDWLIVNEVEAEALTGKSIVDEILDGIHRSYPATALLLTLGSQGAWYAHGKNRFFIPAQKVAAVDTTAAGDTFVGYFLAGVSQGVGVEECLTRATKAAAVCVSRPGAAPSIPKMSELS